MSGGGALKRLPVIAFAVLAVATVFALFLTQNLKTRLPVVLRPTVIPQAFNPVDGNRSCPDRSNQPLDYRHTVLSFSLPQAGTVAVSVINRSGTPVATVSAGRTLAQGQSAAFVWNGRESGGRIAPDGTYFFRVLLVKQGRTVPVTTPITIMTHPPDPTVASVTLDARATTTGTTTTGTTTTGTTTTETTTTGTAGTATTGAGTTDTTTTAAAPGGAGGPVILTPGQAGVTIHYPLHDYRRVWIDVYRTDVSGKPQLVNEFTANPNVSTAHWNGETSTGMPVPAGTYLIGITAQDQACNQAAYPVVLPPSPGATPHAGVTVRYLAATPPLAPVVAGSRAAIAVDSPTGPYSWVLRLAGTRKPLRQGAGVAGSSTLRVHLPRRVAGLYTLALSAGAYTTSVPLVAAAPPGSPGARARVLVVLPMLTWQGESQVDDTGDGLPSTLSAGDRVALDRPLAQGLPRGLRGDVALLSFLSRRHLSYQLTTDVALAEGDGPSLVDRWGVALAGDETWLPAGARRSDSLAAALESFVRGGGRLLSIGTETLKGSSVISGYPSDPVAAPPVTTKTDLFGAEHGPLTSTDGDLITELTDPLGIFGAAPAFSGFDAYTPIEPPAGVEASLAGVATAAPAVAAFTVGKGYVVEIGLDRFNQSLASNVNAQDLLARIWQLLAK